MNSPTEKARELSRKWKFQDESDREILLKAFDLIDAFASTEMLFELEFVTILTEEPEEVEAKPLPDGAAEFVARFSEDRKRYLAKINASVREDPMVRIDYGVAVLGVEHEEFSALLAGSDDPTQYH